MKQSIKVCQIASGDLYYGAEVQIYNIIKGLLAYSPSCEVFAIIMNEGLLFQKLKELGINVYLVDEKKINIFSQLQEIYKVIKENDIDVIHSHRYKENILVGFVKLFFFNKIMLIKTQHGTFNLIKGLSSKMMKFYHFIDLFFSKINFDKIVCVSNDIAKQYEKYVKKKRIITIRNSIDISKFSIPEKQFTKNIVKLAFIGRLVKVKNINEYIEIIQNIVKKRKDITAYIVGSGPEEEKLKDIVCKNKLETVIKFTGEISNIENFYSEFDILMISSIHEGLPTVLLEAMYSKKIVITRKIGGIPEVVEHGVNGFFYSSIAEAVSIINTVYSSEESTVEICNNAHNLIIKEYSNSIQSKKYFELYKEIV